VFKKNCKFGSKKLMKLIPVLCRFSEYFVMLVDDSDDEGPVGEDEAPQVLRRSRCQKVIW
jgi:hypothetical protein